MMKHLRSSVTSKWLPSFANLVGIGWFYRRVYLAMAGRKAIVKRPSYLVLEAFNVCNLKCLMCPYHRSTRKKVSMDMRLYSKIVDDAVESGFREIDFSFYNEPLLDDLLFERIRYAKDKGLATHFFSNGTLLTDSKIRAIVESGLDRITFSIDAATEETYSRIRIGANFEKTKSGILDLVKWRNSQGLKKPFIRVTFLIQEANINEMRDFERFWTPIVDEVAFAVVENIEGQLLPHKLKISARYAYPCVSLWRNLVVRSDGTAALCCGRFDEQLVLGDLSKETIEEVWNSDKFEEIRALHLAGEGSKIAVCKSCSSLYRSSSVAWWWE